MTFRLLLLSCCLLASCGYHFVGQGTSTMIPPEVTSASLQAMPSQKSKLLLVELEQLWQQREWLPELRDMPSTMQHVILRIEQAQVQFSPIAFDSGGLAMQYRLQISAVLNMYQKNALIWSSGAILVRADLFSGDNSSVMEAERELLLQQLQRQWAEEALQRLQSGF